MHPPGTETPKKTPTYCITRLVGGSLSKWDCSVCSPPPHLEQEVVGVVAMVDGGDGIQDGATQHHRLTLQEHGLQHLHNNIQLS